MQQTCRLDPLDLGIKRCEVADLAGGDAQLNASILSDVFGGTRGAVADALNLNAGVALAAAEIAASPAEGVAMAQVRSIMELKWSSVLQQS
jgi:anthranilate phosphoribosyltransferase